MVRRILSFATRLGLLAFALRVRNAAGLPRCDCADHSTPPRAWPAKAPPCVCTSATGAGVSRLCPHASWTYFRGKKHPTLQRWKYDVDDFVRAQMNGSEQAAEEDETSDWDGATDDD